MRLETQSGPVVRVGTATASDGAVLAWTAGGSGPRALLACNGIGVSTFFWRRLSRHFAGLGAFTFLTWDYRGHGRSPIPDNPESMTVAGCARDLWTVADAAGFDHAVLLGHSMGSCCAKAATRPWWSSRSSELVALTLEKFLARVATSAGT